MVLSHLSFVAVIVMTCFPPIDFLFFWPIGYDSDFRYKLCFVTKLKDSIYTSRDIRTESGHPIQVSMLDAHHRTVKSSPFASAKVKIVVLHGDFCTDGRDTWTIEEFEKSIVPRRDQNKKALLVSNLECTFRLEGGEAFISNVHFSDNSKWARSEKFRLGVKLIDDVGERVHEGISNPFKVKHREGSRKVETPSLNDAVWKLNKIGKNGVIHKKLQEAEIYTVGDFLKRFQEDESKLRELVGSNFKKIIQHAKKAIEGDNFGQAPVALSPHYDNMLCANLPNRVSIGGIVERVQPINSSSQINSQFVVTAREQPRTIYNMPSQNEINNPTPDHYVGNFYHGSSSSRWDPHDCLLKLPNQGQVAALGGIPNIDWNNDTNINRYISVPVNSAKEQPQMISNNMFGNCHIGVNNRGSPIDAHFTYVGYNPATTEDLTDNFDVDQFLQEPEPDPAEMDKCHYNEIYNAFSMALSGVLSNRKWIKIVAVVKWRCLTKHSTARQACPAPAF